MLPLPVCRALGRGAGRLAWTFVPRVRRVALPNLDLAYGDTLSRREKRRIGREAATNACIVATELAHTPRIDAAFVEKHIRVQGAEHIDRERGGLIIGAHLGNWEWMGAAVRTFHPRVAGVVRPLNDPALDARVDALRTATGVETIAKYGAGGAVLARLRQGFLVGILIDQSPRENGVPAVFYGQPCWSTAAPAMVAARTKAPVHVVACLREPGGDYTLRFSPPLRLERTGDLRHDLQANTQRCQDAIEALVREHPGQWLWLHRRWKERPGLARAWAERAARRPDGPGS
jgi:KDO2-lipid IV(A) lauroyltransferase